MKRLLLAGVASFAFAASPALAADIPARMPAKAPAYVPLAYNWSGWYLGIQGGYGFGDSRWTDTATGLSTGRFNVDGALLGGTLGVNWQTGNWVLGLEGDGSWSNIRGSTTTNCVPNCQTRNNWLATVRGRVGHAFGSVLPYITGGAAFGDIEAVGGGGTQSSTEVGWTAGAGIEWALAGPWTAKVEYLYADLGKMSCSAAVCTGVAGPTDVRLDTSIVRAGINYRFGPTR
ncbi:MAG: porin family protein [Alphaproteobacteria bacterium]|nr:porin family protein [Alphaproteobacteria bacterium]